MSSAVTILMKPVEGFGVSKVMDSDSPNFKPGDLVAGLTGWEEYSLIRKTEQLRKIQPDDHIPLSYHVGLLGMTFFVFITRCFSHFLMISCLLYSYYYHSSPIL